MGKVIVIEGSHCSGKSSTIKLLCENYNFKQSKSVPEWFRKFIPYARNQKYNKQLMLYSIGHFFAYFNARISVSDYLFDRWIYTTIIRLNYEEGISVFETVKQINNLKTQPDLLIILRAKENIIKERKILRDNEDLFSQSFFQYENLVFDSLTSNNNCVIISNEHNQVNTINEIINNVNLHCIHTKEKILRRKKNDRI